MAFDIASVLKSTEAGKEQIVYLDIDLLDPDENNFYSLDGIGELAGNIELIGLQQPLRVRPGKDGHYVIVSGHRRRAAILLIRDGGSDQFKDGVPCIVEYGEASAAMRELRLIYANAATRVMTSSEISRQAERVETLLYTLKEEGVAFPGRMRDHVAEACRVSKSKLARLHAIRNRLDPHLLHYYDSGEMTEEAAYQLSRLPAEIQEEAGLRLDSGKLKRMPTAYVVEKVNRDLERYQAERPCRSHAGGPDCHWKNEIILYSIFRQYDWQVCTAGQCCRDCYHSKDCSHACQECKDRRKLEKDVEKEKEAERQKREESDQKIYRAQRRKQLRRLLPLIEAAGMSDDDELPPAKGWWGQSMKVSEIRKEAGGDFGDKCFYGNSWGIIPESSHQLKAWAQKLDCSTDYLLGLSDEPKPAAKAVSGPDTGGGLQWSTGTPTEAGMYETRVGIPEEETTQAANWQRLEWIDGRWGYASTHAPLPAGVRVYRWVKLPEV